MKTATPSRAIAALLMLGLSAQTAAAETSFEIFHFGPNFEYEHRGRGISGDGSKIVGDIGEGHEGYQKSTGVAFDVLNFPVPACPDGGKASAASYDGSVVVGSVSKDCFFDSEAIVWSGGATMGTTLATLTLGVDPVTTTKAHDVSRDGTVIVGVARGGHANDLPPYDWTNTWGEAIMWTSGVPTALGVLSDGGINGFSGANGVSADGTVVAGYNSNSNGTTAIR